MSHVLAVIVPTPAHSTVAGPLSYRSELPLAPGTLVRVPLGKREILGVVWEALSEPVGERLELETRLIAGALDGLAPLSGHWRQLVTFAAGYYQRSMGEVALAALPPQLRDLTTTQLARRLKKRAAAIESGARDAASDCAVAAPVHLANTAPRVLSDEQFAALQAFEVGNGPFLLFGATGSGKTEV